MVSGVVSLRDVRVTIDRTPILVGVDLELAEGEWCTIVGPNGAGKSTLLRAIMGTVDFDGEIEIAGLSDSSRPRQRTAELARHIAYLPQSPTVPPGVQVVDYVLLGRTAHRGAFATDSRRDLDIAAEALDRLDVANMADREVASLSGGERQRVVLARALTQQPRVLLLDEPTTALDLGHQQEVLELVEELRSAQNLTVLATLHDLTLAGRHGDRVALMSCGSIAVAGSPSEVLTETNIEQYFGASVRIIDDEAGPIIVPRPKDGV